MPWNIDQVLALAPDASSAKSGKDLSVPRKWATLGANDVCAWGTIKGSGKDPYQASIDLSGPAFKCTCPSRKFPCKHGLGLFLIYVLQREALKETTPPAWTAEWLAKRAEKEEKKSSKSAASEKTDDPEAQAKAAAAAEKRAASREAKVTGGLEDLGVWLDDLVRSGFASIPGKPASFWEAPAARLVDAQAPGLARRVRSLDGITMTGEDWPKRLLHEAALLHLVREGWTRIQSLPLATQADLRSVIGFTVNQEEVLAQPSVRDRWIVVGQVIEEDDRLRMQRTWLFGTSTKCPALTLSFSAMANQPLDHSLIPGMAVDAELVFYSSAWPLRALIKQRYEAGEANADALPHKSIETANAFAAEAFSANPWLERIPFGLKNVVPVRRSQGWAVRDETSRFLPVAISEMKGWSLISVSGGQPIHLSGEWDGEEFTPLGVWSEGRFLRL